MNKIVPIITFLLVTFSAQIANAQITGQGGDTLVIDRILAVVGGHPIFQSEVETATKQAKLGGYGFGGDLRCKIFEDMMISKLFLDQAEIDSIEVSNGEVEKLVEQQLQSYLLAVGGNEEVITQEFNKSMHEIEKDLFKPIKEQKLTQLMEREITVDVRITPSEVQKFYRKLPKEELPLIKESLEINEIVIYPEDDLAEIQRIKAELNGFRDQIKQGTSKINV